MRLICQWLIALFVFAATAPAIAQNVPGVTLPPSPSGQAAIQFGAASEKSDVNQRYRNGKWVVVDYGRPILRGRTNIFGSGAEYGKVVSDGSPVWRMGANDSTQFTTQLPLSIGGKALRPGVYNAFAELKPGAWTFVLSTQPRQPKFDLALRRREYRSVHHRRQHVLGYRQSLARLGHPGPR